MIWFYGLLIVASVVMFVALKVQSHKTKCMWKHMTQQVDTEQHAYRTACAKWDEHVSRK